MSGRIVVPKEGYPELSRYTFEEGQAEAEKAISAAFDLGIPESAILYFAIDYDVMDGETGLVKDYFRGVNSVFARYGYYYRVGIYGARNVCARVSEAGLTVSSFISDMSTGFSGNMGYTMPKNWAFDQFHEFSFDCADGSFDLDKVAYSGRYDGFGSITEPNITLPDVSMEYRLKKAREFFDIFGINLSLNYRYGESVEIDTGYFAVRYKAHYDITVVEGPDMSWATYDIVNGSLSVSVDEMLENIYGKLGTEVTTDIGFTEASMALRAVVQIYNGTMKIGIKVNSDGELVIHIIAKQVLRQSGPATYSQAYELEYVFRHPDNTNPGEEPAFSFAELLEKVDIKNTNFPIAMNIITIVTFAATIALTAVLCVFLAAIA